LKKEVRALESELRESHMREGILLQQKIARMKEAEDARAPAGVPVAYVDQKGGKMRPVSSTAQRLADAAVAAEKATALETRYGKFERFMASRELLDKPPLPPGSRWVTEHKECQAIVVKNIASSFTSTWSWFARVFGGGLCDVDFAASGGARGKCVLHDAAYKRDAAVIIYLSAAFCEAFGNVADILEKGGIKAAAQPGLKVTGRHLNVMRGAPPPKRFVGVRALYVCTRHEAVEERAKKRKTVTVLDIEGLAYELAPGAIVM